MVMFPVYQVWPNSSSRHSERGKKTKQTEEEVGRQHQGMDMPGVWQVPEGSGEQGKMGEKKTGCKIICGAPTTLAVKGLIMMMMNSAIMNDSTMTFTSRLKMAQAVKLDRGGELLWDTTSWVHGYLVF